MARTRVPGYGFATMTYTTPPGPEDIEAIAKAAYREIPRPLREAARDVIIRVEDFPDDATRRARGLESDFDLLGLYRGVDLPGKSVLDTPRDLDMIFLYRRPLLDYWCETGENLEQLVRHVLIHEIGHHFGFSDADMAAIEAEAE